MTKKTARLAVTVLAVCLANDMALAQQPDIADKLFDSVSVHVGQGVNQKLREIPSHLLAGDLRWDKTYQAGVDLGKTRGTLGRSFASLQGSWLEHVSHGYEVVLARHNGLQSLTELGAAYRLRTPDQALGPITVNFSAGTGLSYAFGTPAYEYPTKNGPHERHNVLLMSLFELEWGLASHPDTRLITRIHHRSGLFNTIAPHGYDSDFIVIGLRHRF